MVVKILSGSATFSGVRYNTNKVDSGKGELMKVSGFGALNALGVLKPEDYKNHLKAVSALNKRVSHAQFHATISTKGREHDKYALTQIATEWLNKMGYGDQPYLIIFHKDTANNHVHIVTTRVDRQGKKISSAFEKVRGSQHLNNILGLDEKHSAKQDIEKALSYAFSTKAQFMMILESQGYVLRENDGKLDVMKFGVQQGEVSIATIEQRTRKQDHSARIKQLKAIFHKYAAQYDTTLVPNKIALPGAYAKITKGFTSEFSVSLKRNLGLELIYHASGDKPPYGYTIIDHATKMVVKGGEVMSLKELLDIPAGKRYFDEQASDADLNAEKLRQLNEANRVYYKALLKATMYNYPDIVQGLQHQGLTIFHQGDNYTLNDPGARVFIDIADLLDQDEYRYLTECYSQWAENDNGALQQAYVPGVYIAPDMDDEAIHGRKRRRKGTGRSTGR
ncbi:MAG TPA: relaxase/mobilization nuclease domain-containing protein [Mucilaginibacter sp.]|jgi:hypothetical protein|nr:relaxase/mobilization nuclease domain-containing protein [Mucilaginibacter sp.]